MVSMKNNDTLRVKVDHIYLVVPHTCVNRKPSKQSKSSCHLTLILILLPRH